jgi:glucoamylase
MTRYIVLGNGSFFALYNNVYYIKEIFYPYSSESHLHVSRIGIWKNREFKWLESLSPQIGYEEDTLVSYCNFEFKGSKILIRDTIDLARDFLLREVNIDTNEEIRIFFTFDYHIAGSDVGDTALYDPFTKSLIHYKENRWFLFSSDIPFFQYATGYKEIQNLEGTWRDCEDGELSNNAIANGSVDSAVSFRITSPITFYTWIAAGKSYSEVKKLNAFILTKIPRKLIQRNFNFWKAWSFKIEANYYRDQVIRSALTIASHWHRNGSLPASMDTDIMRFNKDTYTYVWHRDASYACMAMDLLGFSEFSRNFFTFSAQLLKDHNFLFQKYTTEGHWGSSWHPWTSLRNQIPIQEDESALLLYSMWFHYRVFGDIDFIKWFYRPVIVNVADFLESYRDQKTGLPLPSYDLWEERLGTHLYTSAAVFAGLIAASRFSDLFGEEELKNKYYQAAKEIRDGIEKYFFINGYFARTIKVSDGKVENIDRIVDSSTLQLSILGVFSPSDPKILSNRKVIEERLKVNGGIARYENDTYLKGGNKPNAWYITTLWLSQQYLLEGERNKAIDYINWVVEKSIKTGLIPEQIDENGNYPSVCPLIWSHAEFIRAVMNL